MFHVIHELLFINILYIHHLRRLVKYVNHLAIFVSLLNVSPVSSVTEINVDYINVSSCHVSLLYIFVFLLYIILIRSCLY